MDLVRKNTKKYNFKNLTKLLLLLRNSSLVSFLPFEKGTFCNIFTIFKWNLVPLQCLQINFDKSFKKKITAFLHKHIMHYFAFIVSSPCLILGSFYNKRSIHQSNRIYNTQANQNESSWTWKPQASWRGDNPPSREWDFEELSIFDDGCTKSANISSYCQHSSSDGRFDCNTPYSQQCKSYM